jgi:hypothetical protein
MLKKKVCNPRSFLVVNVCNQGETLFPPSVMSTVALNRYLQTQRPSFCVAVTESCIQICPGTRSYAETAKLLLVATNMTHNEICFVADYK